MKITLPFGITVKRAPALRMAGTDFEARTLLATQSRVEIGERDVQAAEGRRGSQQIYGGEREVSNDPRELYWAALPNKIPPKQALWMLKAALGGDLWQQWRLGSAMLDTWPKLAMASHQLREAVSYVKFLCEPATTGGKLSDTARDNRDLVAAALDSMSPDPFSDEKARAGMVYDFTDSVLMGVSLEEIVWADPRRMPGGSWARLPRAAAWTHPRHFSFGPDGRIIIFSKKAPVDAEDRRRYGKGVGERPNPDKMICSQFMSRSGSSLANGFFRQIVWWWCARQYGLDFVLRHAQNFGHPYCDVTYKPGMSATEKQQLVAEIQKGLGNRVLIHPEGTLLNIEPAQNLGTDNPQRWIIEESDREVLYLFLGQTGSTISTPGKLGGEDTHQDVKQERIAGVAEWVAHWSLPQFARMVLRVNRGDDSECPTFKPDFTKPLSSAEVGKLCTDIKSSGVPVKADELYPKIGFTKPEVGDEVFQGGQVVIMGEAMTDDQKFDQELERQSTQQDVLGQPDSEPTNTRGAEVRRIVATMGVDQLDDLETAVRAAEAAPHKNGEARAVLDKLFKHKRRKRS